MKEFIYLLGLMLGIMGLFSLVSAESCEDIGMYQFRITQKLNDHLYEVNFEGYSALLKTRRAVFTKPGMAFGVKIMRSTKQVTSQTLAGFERNYDVYEECGLVRTISSPYGQLSPRKVIKGYD